MRIAFAAAAAAALAVLSAQAEAASSRPSWVVNELYAFNSQFTAAQPAELATKMQKMAVSPFAFYRGTAHIFFRDMAGLPASAYLNAATRKVWLQGDMHLQNFGGVRDANGNDVFDITDFDEGYHGAYTWDVRRMAASIVLAAKELGYSSSDRGSLVEEFVDAYLGKMDEFKGTSAELDYRLKAGDLSGVAKDVVEKVKGNDRVAFLNKYTATTYGARAFLTNDPTLAALPAATKTAITSAVAAYVNTIAAAKRQPTAYYKVKDVRQKLGSGVGSLGKARYYVLIEGPTTGANDDVILEIKQQTASAVAIAAPGALPTSVYGNHEGARAAISMKANLTNTDPLVGYATISGKPYLVREKSPFQEDFDYTKLDSYTKFKDAVRTMGKVLAKSHAISDQDYDAAIISYSQDKQVTDVVTSKSGFKTETKNFAIDYAAQVELDYNAFKSAYQSGAKLY